MAHDLYLRLHQTLEQRRRLGARGGRAAARNRRARLRATAAPLRPAVAVGQRPAETVAEAIAALDAQFPWLRGMEKRRRPSQAARVHRDAAAAPIRGASGLRIPRPHLT